MKPSNYALGRLKSFKKLRQFVATGHPNGIDSNGKCCSNTPSSSQCTTSRHGELDGGGRKHSRESPANNKLQLKERWPSVSLPLRQRGQQEARETPTVGPRGGWCFLLEKPLSRDGPLGLHEPFLHKLVPWLLHNFRLVQFMICIKHPMTLQQSN